jgi:LEA14-like dessication related protein
MVQKNALIAIVVLVVAVGATGAYFLASTMLQPVSKEVPKMTVDLTGMTTGSVVGNKATIIIFLTATNPSSSPVKLTSIKYDIWINDVAVGLGGTDTAITVNGKSILEVRTEMIADLSDLPQDIVDALTVEGAEGTLHIKGTMQIQDGFGTASVPFEGEGNIGVPIAT